MEPQTNYRIRKLTPRETGRLMGMNDNQINKQLSAVSNSQAYKQHGNGIVVDVFSSIINNLVEEETHERKNQTAIQDIARIKRQRTERRCCEQTGRLYHKD